MERRKVSLREAARLVDDAVSYNREQFLGFACHLWGDVAALAKTNEGEALELAMRNWRESFGDDFRSSDTDLRYLAHKVGCRVPDAITSHWWFQELEPAAKAYLRDAELAAAQLELDNLALAHFFLYRDLFPWFGPAMVKAGYQFGERTHSPEVQAIWRHADTAWREITNIAPLHTADAWNHAARAAGWKGPSGDIDSAKRAISAWAAAKLANMPPGTLDKLSPEAATPAAGNDEREEQRANESLTWQEAAKRMENLRQQGEPFTSQPKLAKQLVCSSGTINKAIWRTESLRQWAITDAVPKAQSATGLVVDNTAQSRDIDPADDAAIREYLERDDLSPEERAFFNSLSPQNQIDFLNDPDAHSLNQQPRILGRKP